MLSSFESILIPDSFMYCSDLHEGDPQISAENEDFSIYQLKLPKPLIIDEKDNDGDLIKITKFELPFIPGKMEIQDVGYQIWRASFFLR